MPRTTKHRAAAADSRLLCVGAILCAVILGLAFADNTDSTQAEAGKLYGIPEQKPKSLLFSSFPDSAYPIKEEPTLGEFISPEDTVELPKKEVAPDSFRTEFRKYWAWYEKETGTDKLRDQVRARSHEGSRIPHWYFFDSTLVIYPGWFFIRLK